MRFFNVAGPVDPARRYSVPSLSRVPLDRIEELVEFRDYFTLRAPRQSGKTTLLGALQEHLNQRGWRCVYASCEEAGAVPDDVESAFRAILSAIADDAATVLGDESLEAIWPEALARDGAYGGFQESLARWSEQSGNERLVLLLDEADAPRGRTLASLLSQIRVGHQDRPRRFPRSILFCGLRDVRDCASPSWTPFNIVAESFRLGDFSRAEVEELLGQHTEETGQRFAAEAVEEIWSGTAGQPWLVNALAKETCFEDEVGRDRTREIGVAAVRAARERLIRERASNLRHLAHKLKEEPVRRVIEPIVAGCLGPRPLDNDDDLSYVKDLGFTKADRAVEIANPIYREAIPRFLGASVEHWLTDDDTDFRRPDSGLEAEGLLTAFRKFFREHTGALSKGFLMPGAAAQVLLQAFCQRVVDAAGGRITREYGLVWRQTDLLIEQRRGERTQRFVVACKVRWEWNDPETTIRRGVARTAAYRDACGAEEAHLVVVDPGDDRPWEERAFRRTLRARRTSDPKAQFAWELAPDDDAPGAETPETLPIEVWGL